MVALICVLAASCAVPLDRVELTSRNASELLPAVGPSAGTTHWHAAYVVRVCDEIVEPFASDADPLGIHSHADGLIHIHPFFEEAGFERAQLSLFADAMGFELTDGYLRLPDGREFRDGDLCRGVPGRIFVDRWQAPDPSTESERLFVGLDDLRFLADGELYHIGFAADDAPAIVPPSWELLSEVSNLIGEGPDPWVVVDRAATSASVRLWQVDEISEAPCRDDQVSEIVATGEPLCFTPSDSVFERGDAVADARAVMFNRLPAVELTITPQLRQRIVEWFGSGNERGFVLAVEVAGRVVIAPSLARLPASQDRLVIAGGLTIGSATDLAMLLAGG